MSSALIGNNITGRQLTKIKVDRWFSLEFFSGKYVKKQYKYCYVCMHHGPLWMHEIT
jgi:hypothetical protein